MKVVYGHKGSLPNPHITDLLRLGAVGRLILLERRLHRVFTLSLIALMCAVTDAQENPLVHQGWNIFDINRVRTQFNNTRLLCDGNQQSMALARPPAFESPNGSGISYGTGVEIVIGMVTCCYTAVLRRKMLDDHTLAGFATI